MDEQQGTPHQHARGGCFFCDIAGPQIEAFIDHVGRKTRASISATPASRC